MLFVFAVCAIVLAFKTLEQGKYALQLNWSSQKVSNDVLSVPGLYMVGLGNMLIEYPSTFQNMYFVDSGGGSNEFDINRPALRARSKDGLEMRISVSFQWKFEPSSLLPVYSILGGGDKDDNLYKDEFVRFARGALVESCSFYGAAEYFTNRTEITSMMYEKVQTAFNRPDKDLYVSIKGLQLREVTLPKAFDDEIVLTQKEMQEVQVAKAERTEKEITQQRNKAVMEEKVRQMRVDAEGVASATRQINVASVDTMLVLAKETALSNAKLLDEFQLGDSSLAYQKLFEAMQVNAITSHESQNLILDV
jgi:hypothetical protein